MQCSRSIFLRWNGTAIHLPQNRTYRALSRELHSAYEDRVLCLAVQNVYQQKKKKRREKA
jgi:hypothetical protein